MQRFNIQYCLWRYLDSGSRLTEVISQWGPFANYLENLIPANISTLDELIQPLNNYYNVYRLFYLIRIIKLILLIYRSNLLPYYIAYIELRLLGGLVASTPTLSMGGAGSTPAEVPYFLAFWHRDIKWGAAIYAGNNPFAAVSITAVD